MSISKRILPFLLILVGVVLGVVLTNSFSPPSAPASTTAIQKAAPLYSEPLPPPNVKEPGQPEQTPKTAPAKEEDADKKSEALASPPKSMPGALPSGPINPGLAPLRPIVIEGDSGANGAEASYTEYSAIVSEVDVELLLERIKAAAAQFGCPVVIRFETDPDHPDLGAHLVFSVPGQKALGFREGLAKVDGLRETNNWTGSFSQRHSKMTAFLREPAEKLKDKLDELRAKYFDDAPAVRQAQESLERYQKALRSLPTVPREREVVRVYVGKSRP